MRRSGLILAVLWSAVLAGAGDSPAAKWTAFSGINKPESVFFDVPSGNVFVSNIAGESDKKDGVGWISKLTPDGKVAAEKWIDGLNAPKGLRTWGSTLWVSDIDELLGISIAEGKITQRIKIEGAVFLNDVATHPDGTVYVTDSRANKIFSCKDGKAALFTEGEALESPNGIVVDAANNRLVVAALGAMMDGKRAAGHLYQLDLKTKEKKLITPQPLGTLDGLELDGQGGYLVSDNPAGKIFHVFADGRAENIVKFSAGSADLHYLPEQSLLIVPIMPEGVVCAFTYKP